MGSEDIEENSKMPEGIDDEFQFSQSRPLRAGLYLVATPIGNLRDITLRALDVLRGADVILCEDTRVSGKLLSAYQIKGRLISCNDHSEVTRIDEVIGYLAEEKIVALISDAGMPLISDPGFKLVRACREAGQYITSVPGANAPLSAIQLSAMPSDAFSFIGFLPNKMKARRDLMAKWAHVPSSLVAFESANRLIAALHDIHAVMAGREVAVVREITKLYEEVRRGRAQELAIYYEENGAPKGEIVLVVAPPEDEVVSDEDAEEMLVKALETMRTKDAAAFVAEQTGRKKKEIYDMALRLGA
ncbi:MAG: 16S rRNA (cytidine(1402)-2'-O)-methyltransferase [Alphaproteobacteria bacterium]